MATTRQLEMKRTFDRLAKEWKRETAQHSSISKMAMHPAYQRIIELGEEVVPLILKDLQKKPQHWFWALSSITNESPLPPKARGDMRAMSEAWIEWGRRNHYID